MNSRNLLPIAAKADAPIGSNHTRRYSGSLNILSIESNVNQLPAMPISGRRVNVKFRRIRLVQLAGVST
jgi:hypothetical protein